MKDRPQTPSATAETAARWLTAATGGQKSVGVAEVVARVEDFERLSSPIVLAGSRNDLFRSAVSFQVIKQGPRTILDPRVKAATRMRPDVSLVLTQDRDGSIHPLILLDPDLTPSRAHDDLRLRLSKQPIGRWRKFGLPDGWHTPSLHAKSLTMHIRENSSTDSLPGLAAMIADLLGDVPVRSPFDGRLNAVIKNGAIHDFSLTVRKGKHSVGAWPDAEEERGAERSIRAGQEIGRLANRPALMERLAESYAKLITRAVLKAVDTKNEKAAASFLDLLDVRVFDVMREHGEVSIPLYNWMAAGSDDKLMAVRRQAFESYPLLVSSLVSTRPETLACVDEEANFVDSVSAEIGTTRRAVRSLGGIRQQDLSDIPNPAATLLDMAPSLCHLPDTHLPSSGGSVPAGQQWKSLALAAIGTRRAIKNIKNYKAEIGSATWESKDPPMADVMVELKQEAPFWTRKQGLAMSKAVYEGAWHIDDLRREFAISLVYPVIRDLDHDGALIDLGWSGLLALCEKDVADGSSAIGRTFLRCRSPIEIARIAGEYMERADRITAKIASSARWKAWSDARTYSTRYGTVTITPLTDGQSLAEEGEAMGHCVATYVRGASTGNCHIYSVKDENGSRLSTIDLRLGPDGDFRIVQHEGLNHGEPPSAARLASTYWLDDIHSGRLEVTPFRLDITPETRWQRHVGYDPGDTGLRDKAIRAWGFALPAEERGMTHAGWAEFHGLPDLIAEAVAELRTRPSAA